MSDRCFGDDADTVDLSMLSTCSSDGLCAVHSTAGLETCCDSFDAHGRLAIHGAHHRTEAETGRGYNGQVGTDDIRTGVVTRPPDGRAENS